VRVHLLSFLFLSNDKTHQQKINGSINFPLKTNKNERYGNMDHLNKKCEIPVYTYLEVDNVFKLQRTCHISHPIPIASISLKR
jgi:hypothetical protein